MGKNVKLGGPSYTAGRAINCQRPWQQLEYNEDRHSPCPVNFFTGTDPGKWLRLCTQKCIKVFIASWFKEKSQGIFIKRKQKKQIMFMLMGYERAIKTNSWDQSAPAKSEKKKKKKKKGKDEQNNASYKKKPKKKYGLPW